MTQCCKMMLRSGHGLLVKIRLLSCIGYNCIRWWFWMSVISLIPNHALLRQMWVQLANIDLRHCINLNITCLFVLTIFNEGVYTTLKFIFHKALKDGIIAIFIYFYIFYLRKRPVFPFSCWVLNKGATGTLLYIVIGMM